MVVKSEHVKEALIKFVLYPFQKYYFGFDIKKILAFNCSTWKELYVRQNL